jgi:hypothetical protein
VCVDRRPLAHPVLYVGALKPQDAADVQAWEALVDQPIDRARVDAQPRRQFGSRQEVFGRHVDSFQCHQQRYSVQSKASAQPCPGGPWPRRMHNRGAGLVWTFLVIIMLHDNPSCSSTTAKASTTTVSMHAGSMRHGYGPASSVVPAEL